MKIAVFTKGAIIETPNNNTVIVIDYYSLDAKNIRIIAVAEDFDICILKYNLDTNKYSIETCYNTIQMVAKLRKF